MVSLIIMISNSHIDNHGYEVKVISCRESVVEVFINLYLAL